MTQHIQLNYKDPVHEGFFDPIQELLGAAAPSNFRITVLNSTTLQIVAAEDNGQVAIAINGRYRYRVTTTTAAIGGLPKGNHPVFVTATDNNFSGPVSDPDEGTNYSFGLEIKEVGKTPATPLYRQVGLVSVEGGAIVGFEQTVNQTTGPMLAAAAFSAEGDIEWTRDKNGAWVCHVRAAPVEGGLVPVASMFATALSVAPSGYLLCQGQTVSRTTYKNLWEAIKSLGWGVGDGTTTFNVPDLRGRVPVGVDGAAGRLGSNDTLAAVGGAEKVALALGQVPSHKHADGTLAAAAHSHLAGTLKAASHGHHLNLNTSGVGNHTHAIGPGQQFFRSGSGATMNLNGAGGAVSPETTPAGEHYHNTNGDTEGAAPAVEGSTASSGGDVSGETSAAGGGEEHQNMPPYAVVNWVIKY